ncbi:MAG TPA: CAAX prenyl protease-related protein [Burkholderiaceae bacterium]|jgi:CAAX prenyl protease-like protein|nr:CAAX prenyl protease-related protein [Burkholderiaceae bacterium]
MFASLSRSAYLRIIPFVLFMALLAARGNLPSDIGFDLRWIYGASTLLVGGLLLWWWREYGELTRQNFPTAGEFGLAIFVGLAVFGLWIVLDAPWMVLGEPGARFVPLDAAGAIIWPLVVVRLVGASLVVPVMEELFWRSFIMRWVQSPVFESVDPRRVGVKAIVLSTFIFVLAHTLWLAAAVAGLAYALLYRQTGKLWVAVIAHAVTNLVLGLWVVRTGNWAFW